MFSLPQYYTLVNKMGNQGMQAEGQGGYYLLTGANRDNFGYRVIEMGQDSAASKSGLEPFLDFIIYKPKMAEDGCSTLLFSEYLIENIGKSIILTVYNMI